MIRIDFTKEQFERLKEVANEFIPYGLYLVSDGFVNPFKDKVWWHHSGGPVEASVSADIVNIRSYPEYYSIQKPTPVEVEVTYESLFIEE